MRADRPELRDYEVVRAQSSRWLLETVQQPTLVLGSAQSAEILTSDASTEIEVCWRRGGGGLVWLRPGDWWCDVWISARSTMYRADPTEQALLVGEWWRQALSLFVADATVATRVSAGPTPVACFAGIGPGEVLVDDNKLVGVTQWRVREGALVSTVAHLDTSEELVAFLRDPNEGLARQLQHATVRGLGLDSHRDDVLAALVAQVRNDSA